VSLHTARNSTRLMMWGRMVSSAGTGLRKDLWLVIFLLWYPYLFLFLNLVYSCFSLSSRVYSSSPVWRRRRTSAFVWSSRLITTWLFLSQCHLCHSHLCTIFRVSWSQGFCKNYFLALELKFRWSLWKHLPLGHHEMHKHSSCSLIS
jgi:hypothetical protein